MKESPRNVPVNQARLFRMNIPNDSNPDLLHISTQCPFLTIHKRVWNKKKKNTNQSNMHQWTDLITSSASRHPRRHKKTAHLIITLSTRISVILSHVPFETIKNKLYKPTPYNLHSLNHTTTMHIPLS